MISFKFLTKDYPIENSYFLISKFCLHWLGQYPQINPSFLRNLNCLCHFLILFFGVVGQFWYGVYYIKIDLVRGIDAICPAIPCMVTVIKMVFLIWNGKKLHKLLTHMQIVLFKELNEENKKILQDFAATATKLAFMNLVSGILANIFYSLRPIVTNVIRLSMGMPYLFDETALKVMVPSVLLTMPWYPFTYALVSYMAQICITCFSGVDGIFVSFCLYSAALFKVLQKDMGILFENCYNSSMSADENRKCYRQLRGIVRRHNEIIDMVKSFSSLFVWIILSHFVTSAITMGASITQILLYPGFRALIYTTYTLACFCELFMYCYGGSAVIENSLELGKSAYLSNWYLGDSEVRKAVLMIIIRSQKPIIMDVPFFTPSLETFTVIIQTAGSIIAVVKSVL